MQAIKPETPTHQISRRRFTVSEYYRMADAGILHEDDRVELIDGEILEMSPIGSPHAGRVKRTATFLQRLLGDTVIVSVQDPIHISESTEPQPDIALLKPREDFYSDSHPTPEDILLLIEVADSSLEYDRNFKLSLYARVGIREVWILNLREDVLEVYSRLVDGEYRDTARFKRGEKLRSKTVAGLELSADDVLGQPSSTL